MRQVREEGSDLAASVVAGERNGMGGVPDPIGERIKD
jgi:hypothetical protein